METSYCIALRYAEGQGNIRQEHHHPLVRIIQGLVPNISLKYWHKEYLRTNNDRLQSLQYVSGPDVASRSSEGCSRSCYDNSSFRFWFSGAPSAEV